MSTIATMAMRREGRARTFGLLTVGFLALAALAAPELALATDWV